jgi:hypothetical protein
MTIFLKEREIFEAPQKMDTLIYHPESNSIRLVRNEGCTSSTKEHFQNNHPLINEHKYAHMNYRAA